MNQTDNTHANDARNLRGLGGADFDYADRSALNEEAGVAPYILLHTHAESRIALAGGTVQHELAIRDAGIDFLRDQLNELGVVALSFVTATRLTSEMRKAGIEIPLDVKQTIASLFEQLEALVGGA